MIDGLDANAEDLDYRFFDHHFGGGAVDGLELGLNGFEMFDTLNRISQRLCHRLRRRGVELAPNEIGDVLLCISGGYTMDAIHNGYQYLSGRHSMDLFIAECNFIFPVGLENETN